MHVEIERATKPLDNGHRTAASIRHAVGTRAAAQPSQHGTHIDRDHRAAQLVVPRQLVPQAMRYAEHPLSHRHIGEHGIHQVRGTLGHPPAAATWTEAAPLTRERHQSVETARGAAESREPAGQPPAPQKVPKLVFDKPRQPLALPQRGRLRTECLEVVENDLIERAPRWLPWFVRCRGQGHAKPAGGCRASE